MNQEKMAMYLRLAGWHEVTRHYFDYSVVFSDGEFLSKESSEWRLTPNGKISFSLEKAFEIEQKGEYKSWLMKK
jgi:hypothetical protein